MLYIQFKVKTEIQSKNSPEIFINAEPSVRKLRRESPLIFSPPGSYNPLSALTLISLIFLFIDCGAKPQTARTARAWECARELEDRGRAAEGARKGARDDSPPTTCFFFFFLVLRRRKLTSCILYRTRTVILFERARVSAYSGRGRKSIYPKIDTRNLSNFHVTLAFLLPQYVSSKLRDLSVAQHGFFAFGLLPA